MFNFEHSRYSVGLPSGIDGGHTVNQRKRADKRKQNTQLSTVYQYAKYTKHGKTCSKYFF